jgi:hypothetical protein
VISDASLPISLSAECERIIDASPSIDDAHTEGMIMSSRQLIGGFAAALVGAGAILASVGATQATMLPVSRYATPDVQHVDCAFSAHIGPLGACIISHDNNPPIVVEHRVVDAPDLQAADGCSTKSVTRTDGSGASETHTKTNC